MGACLDAGKELAKAYKDTPADSARQTAALQNFISKCGTGAVVANPGSTLPSGTAVATGTTPAGQVESGTLPGVLDGLRTSSLWPYISLAFWGALIWIAVVVGLKVVKSVRKI